MHVTRLGLGLALTAGALALAACSDATSPTPTPSPSLGVARTGNGAPSGAHYTLNIIGMEKGKTADMTGDNGRRMFVSLGQRDGAVSTRINLTMGDFGVIDANGTDGVASFSLPHPDPDGDGVTAYSVYVRALGKPGGKATMQTCYDDAQTGETWCAVDYVGGVEPITIERTKGGVAKFENVSKDLLYVDVCTSYDTETGECTAWDQLPLFSDELDAYFWQYDNEGLRLAQLRFYEIPTTTPW